MAKKEENCTHDKRDERYGKTIKQMIESIVVGALTMLMLSVLSMGILLAVMVIS